MAEIFLHGRETVENDAGNPRYVQTIDSGILWIVGTAPNANETLYPFDQPRVMRGYNDFPEGLGSTGTLPDQLDLILKQAGRMSQTVCFARVEEGDTPTETLANIIGSRAARTGLHALSRVAPEFNLRPKLIGAPGFTSQRPTDGVSAIAITDGGDGYTSAPTVAIARGVGDTTGVGAAAVATTNDAGEVDAIVLTNPGLGYTAVPVVTLTGGGGGSGATATA
ncbi:MAG: phage tail protein, partial [Beijerinckiaceae bacterium]|nr:phage tail protein [Beijerinckiaceae bacterium]